MSHDPNRTSSSISLADDERQPKIPLQGPSPQGESLNDSGPETHAEERHLPPSSRQRRGSSRRRLPSGPTAPLRKIIIFLAIGLALYVLTGFFLAPYLLTTALPAHLTQKTNRPVTIGSAKVNPFTLHFTLKNGIIGQAPNAVDDPIDPIFSFGSLEARINPFKVLNQGLNFHAIRGSSVFLHLRRQPDGTFNISTLLKQLTGQDVSFHLSKIGNAVQAGNLHLTNSRLIFEDAESDTKHTLEAINFSLPQKNRESATISPRFSAIIDGSPIAVGGQAESSTSGMSTSLTFSLEKINLVTYLTYLPQPLPGLLTKGEADMELVLDYRNTTDNTYHFEISGTGRARDIWLQTSDKGENKIAAANFSISFFPLLSQLTIKKLVLEKPELQLHRLPDGTYIFPGSHQTLESRDKEHLALTTLIVKNGRLSYIDQQVEGGFGVIFDDINLSMDRPSPESTFHAYALNSVTSRQTRIASQGKFFLKKREINGLLILHNLPVAALNSYMPKDLGIALTSGVIDKAEADMVLHLKQPDSARFSLSNMKGTATNIVLNHQGKQWLQATDIAFADASLASTPHGFSLGSIRSSGLQARLGPENAPLFSGFSTGKAHTPQPKQIFRDLSVTNSTLILHNFPFQKMAEIPVQIKELTATDLHHGPNNPGSVKASFSLPDQGEGELTGNIKPFPLTGELDIHLQHISLPLFATRKMQWFSPEITQGNLSFRGKLTLPELHLNGESIITDLLAVDPTDRSKRFSLKKGTSPKLELHLSPLKLASKSLIIDGLHIFAPLTAQNTSFDSLFLQLPDKEKTVQNTLSIEQVRLQNSSLAFRDERLNPPFNYHLTGIAGTLTGLKNSREAPLHFDISATGPDQTTLKTTGSLVSSDGTFATDFTMGLTNQPLDPFIPYLEPLIGHRLTGGVFNMDINYSASGGKLNAETTLTLRHLTLGDDGDNRQLPLVLALVSDTHQMVNLQIPVSGDVTDPSYTFHSAYGKKLRGLISKASVSPFAIMTEFYDPETSTPDHILFEPGSSEPSEGHDDVLKIVHKILAARPLLLLNIKGYSSGSRDREALLHKKKDEEEKKRLALQKIQSSELITSYGAEEIAPPPSPSLVDQISTLTVSKDELTTLAQKRCQRLKEILVDHYGVDEERILISPSTTVVPESGVGLVGTRAEFSLSRMP